MSSAASPPVDPRLAKLQAGEPLEFLVPPKDKEETPEERQARTIPAEWLADLAAEHKRIVSVPLRISGAIITGQLDLRYATFECDLSMTDCEFTGSVDFSFATFQRAATFWGSHFRQAANFGTAHAEAYFEILGASFADGSSFQDLHVAEVLQASGATFGGVNFERIDIGKSAFFRAYQGNRTTFGGEARFLGARIQGVADYRGAEFKGEASFDGLRVDGGAVFRTDDQGNRTTFGGEARFHGAQIQGDADYSGAEFKGKASFDRLRVDGSAFFRTDDHGNRTTFGGVARFLGAHIQRNASYIGAEFNGETHFDRLQVDGGALFRPDSGGNRVTFEGPACFPGATFGVDTQFIEADFKGTADFDDAHFGGAARFDSAEFSPEGQATFIGACFEGGCHFNSTQFRGKTDFTAATIERDAQFAGSRFSGPTSFREARFHAVFFGEPLAGHRKLSWPPWKHEPDVSTPAVFDGPLDLRGFTYERIYADLPGLCPKLTPFDRQPYSQLESSLRKAGDDRRAHHVYLERRRVERKEKFRSGRIDLWLLDWLYKLVARYGVRPYQLPVLAVVLILFGACLFSQPGALEPKNPGARLPANIGFWQGLAVSVHYFLPMDTPLGAELVPAATRTTVGIGKKRLIVWPSPTWYATIFLRVSGTVLVGVGVAAAAGLLRRIAP